MKFLRLLLLSILLWGPFLWAEEVPAGSTDIVIEAIKSGELNLSTDGDIAMATNGFAIRFQDGVLTAQRGTINKRTGEILVEGDVLLERGNQSWRGERLDYNFITRLANSGEFRAGRAPFYAAGKGLAGNFSTNTFAATNAFLTTDDVLEPGYRISARRLTLVEGKYYEAKDAVLYLGKVPVFYWPYYRQSVDAHSNHWMFTPGYRNSFGPFLLGAYNWYWDERLYGAIHVDYRQKIGVGFGPDVNFKTGTIGEGHFTSYYIRDRDPDAVGPTFGYPVPEDRERLTFSYRIAPVTNLNAKVYIRQQSDPYITRDFFEAEYRQDTQPSSFAEASYTMRNFSLNALTVLQVNNFQETIERLPDVQFTGLRQQLGVSPFYYETVSSLGYFRHSYDDNFFLASSNYAAVRADTFHQLLLPQTLFGWLNVTPFGGARFTYYTAATGPGAYTSEQERWVFDTGAEVSFKASRIFDGAQSRLLDVKGIRHIIQPGLQYVYVPTPNVRPPELPQFDSQLPSLELLPITFPDYNSIDTIDSENTLRMGVRNKLQTKRADGIENLLNWSVYTDWRITQLPGQSRFSDVYSKLDFSPRSWITVSSQLRMEVGGPFFREIDTMITLNPNNVWSLSLGQFYVRNDPVFEAYSNGPYHNNLWFGTFFYRLNENYAFRAYARFNALDQLVEEQDYTIYRDLRSLTAALTFRLRKSLGQPNDFGVAVTFSFKAFPRFKQSEDANKPSLLLGG
jgi:lipopolysaccharide assembly outer membrane protein LptD (OstA)